MDASIPVGPSARAGVAFGPRTALVTGCVPSASVSVGPFVRACLALPYAAKP